MKKRVEILAPAGNLEKLKSVVNYGADAVFFGGEEFNLRDKAGNFSLDEINEALTFCKERGVKTTFLLNSFLHETDIKDAKRYIDSIKDFDFTAVMVADPGMLSLVKEAGIKSRLHLSTQMSTLNHLAVKFWESVGIDRIVLGREVSIDEVKMMRDNCSAELEIFMHGALCISYSGRCLLSRYLSGRDANQGACSHPCRWKFSLMEEKRPGHHLDFIEHAQGTEILSSKDLCLLEKIPEYVKAGVNAFKLEGRMKSLYYGANITRIYKDALETCINDGDFEGKLDFWRSELDLVSHRPYTDDPFNEFNNMGFQEIPYIKKVMFLGLSEKGGSDEVMVKAYNPIRTGDKVEAIFPIIGSKVIDDSFTVMSITDNEKEETMARPGRVCRIKFDKPVADNAIFRKRLQ